MEETIGFLHLSDTHLCFAQPCPPICGTPQQLEAVYAFAAGLDKAPRFVLITGDLVHEGSAQDYARARTLVDRLDETYHLRTYVALGNHDRHAAFYEGYCGTPQRTGRYYYSRQEAGVRLLVLDSAVDDQVPGNLDDAQLDWLEAALAEPCAAPTVVALHHPPCGTAVRETNGNNLCAPERFLELLRSRPVAAVLAGHKHQATACAAPGGTPVYTGAGLAFGIELPRGGSLRFVKSAHTQYCAVYGGQLYWAPVSLDEKTVLAEMTPRQMREYHADK